METTLTKELQGEADEEAHNLGFSGTVKLSSYDNRPSFSGQTYMVNKTTQIKHNPEYENENPGQSQRVVRDIVAHEYDHHGGPYFLGCPRTLDYSIKLIHEPMSDVLIEEGFSEEDASYLGNTFSDSLLHCDLGREKSLEGIVDFFEDVGKYSEDSKYSDFYTAHVMLNMFLFGSKSQKKRASRFYSDSKKAGEVVQRFVNETGLGDLKRESVRNNEKLRNYLMNKKNWPELAKVYAREFSKLIEPSYAMPIFNHSGAGTRGRESEDSTEEGNEFDKERKSKEVRMKRVREAHEKGEGLPRWLGGTGSSSNDEEIEVSEKMFESLDLLYQSLARSLKVVAESYTESRQMPVCYYGKRDFNPERDDMRHVSYGFDDNGNSVLKKKRFSHNISVPIKTKEKGFPNARFGLFDASGSMFESIDGSGVGKTNVIPWGDNSKYHYGNLAFYGLMEYLKANGLLSGTGIELAAFSGSTRVGSGIVEAKKVALSPEGGGTKLNFEDVRHMFSGRDNLIFTISDGGIQNWDDVSEEFIKRARNHHYFHLQIGSDNATTKSLKSAGLKVEPVTSGYDLVNRTIDLTDKLLRGGRK